MPVKRKRPIGSEWRILAHGKDGGRVDIRSKDYDRFDSSPRPDARYQSIETVFDELVIRFGNDLLHLEQMNNREWCLILGEEIRMLRVDRKGKLVVGEMYK